MYSIIITFSIAAAIVSAIVALPITAYWLDTVEDRRERLAADEMWSDYLWYQDQVAATRERLSGMQWIREQAR